MELSQVFGFLKIFSGSIKVFLENAKSIAFITLLSLLSSSILFFLFTYLYQSAMAYMTNSIMNSDTGFPAIRIISCFTLLFALDLIFIYSYITITHASGIATILASQSSYSPNKLRVQDLYSTLKAKWKSPAIRKKLGGSRSLISSFLLIFAVGLAVPLVMFYPTPLTITLVSVAGISIFIFLLYASLVYAVAHVISVVEDGCEGAEALEKAEKLVQGQRLPAFMVNLLINLLTLIILWVFWMIVGDKGSFNLNFMVYGLFYINLASLLRIVGSVVYTVYYFQCMEYHADTIQVLGNFHYTVVSNDIP